MRRPGATLSGLAEQPQTSGLQVLQPSDWPQPKGYANGIMAEGRLVVTCGVAALERNRQNSRLDLD